MRRAVSVLIAVAIAIVLGGGGCKAESEHLERARKLMANGQWANARTALGRVLEDNDRDPVARGLLLYCLDHEDGLAEIADLEMYLLYQIAVAVDAPAWGQAGKELRTWVEKAVIDARKALFDRGVDTKDGRDLVAVIAAAAGYGFAHEKDPERRDRDAAILALQGSSGAISHLLERLKSQDPEAVVGYLVDIGEPTLAGLRRVIADEEFIGRRPAREAQARVLASARGRAMYVERPGLRDPTGAESTLAGRDRLGKNATSMVRDPGAMHVHAQVLVLEDGTDEGLVLLQSWNDRKSSHVLELHAIRGGDLHRLTVTRDGKPFDLAGTSAVFGLTADRGSVVVRRLRERAVATEVETGRVAAPVEGLRVRLRGHTPHGQILRADDGLWVVRMDDPIEGMDELPVTASALIGLRTERRTEIAVETITGVLKHDAFEIRTTNLETEKPHD